MTNLLFLFVGIFIGYFIDKSRLEEKAKTSQEKINTSLKKTVAQLKRNKIEKISFKQ